MEKSHINYLMTKIICMINKNLLIDCAVGLGEEVEGYGYMWQSYHQAKFAGSEKIIQGYNKIFTFKGAKETEISFKLIEDNRRLFTLYLEKGKCVEALNYIEQLFNEFAEIENIGYVDIKNLCTNIYICIKDFLYKNQLCFELILGEKFDFINELMQFDNMDQIKAWIKNVVYNVIMVVFKGMKYSGEDIVKEAMAYVCNYYNQDITLEVISRKYYINKQYFCRLFKDKTGKNFNDYLTEVRVTNACKLIKKVHLKVSEISELVGYNDPKYFSKVFKKGTGLSPSEYLQKIDKVGN